MPACKRNFALIAFCALFFFGLHETAVAEAGVRYDTPSGLPVPRFVSLKTGKTYCRQGPSFDHPVKFTYMQRGLPVVVIAETTNHWRKVRDIDGDECWSHRSKLSGSRTAMVRRDGVTLYAKAADDAAVRAVLGHGVIVEIDDVSNGWARVAAAGRRGWIKANQLWGANAADRFAAPHN